LKKLLVILMTLLILGAVGFSVGGCVPEERDDIEEY